MIHPTHLVRRARHHRFSIGLTMAAITLAASGCTINVPDTSAVADDEQVEAVAGPGTEENEPQETIAVETEAAEADAAELNTDPADTETTGDSAGLDSQDSQSQDGDDRTPEEMQADFDEASERLDDLMAELDEDIASLDEATDDSADNSSLDQSAVDYTLPGGFTMHTGRSGRFQVALPDYYRVVDLDAEDMEEMMRDLSDDPQRAAQAAEMLEASDQFKLWAFDFSRADSEFTPNVNIQVYPAGPLERNLDLIEEQIPAHFASQGLDLVRMRRTTLPAGEMLRLESIIPSVAFDGYVVQVLMVRADTVFSLNFTYRGEPTADQKGDLEKALQSFNPIG